MSSVVSCVEFFEATEGSKELLGQALMALAERSRQEEGCLQYDVIQDKENDHLFVLVLLYQDQQAMQAHEAQPYVVEFAENDMNVLCKQVKWYDGKKIF